MRVLAKHPRLSDFWKAHPDSEKPLAAWHQFVTQASWNSFSDVRRDYAHADVVGRFVVFNIGGNKYRLAVVISYPKAKVYIQCVMTHKEYDRGQWKED